MFSASPKVSVLVPTFNYARFLPEAIESVLAQDFADYELIIADDASADHTAEIVRAYAGRDSRIRGLVHPRNVGMVANWNWCLSRARGEYVKFVFGDDCLTERHSLGRLVAALDTKPSAVLAASARLILDENSRPIEVWNDFRHPGRHDGLAVVMRCINEDRNLVGEPSAALFRRNRARRGFDPDFRQVVDQEFWFHLLLGGDFVYLPEPLCAFRQHETQQSLVNRRVHVGPRESLLILNRYIDALSNPATGGFTPWQRRRMLYRRLHYSRKNVPRSAMIVAAEAALRAHLPMPWYALAGGWHRLTKPAHNLRRYLRRQWSSFRGAGGGGSMTGIAWRPLVCAAGEKAGAIAVESVA